MFIVSKEETEEETGTVDSNAGGSPSFTRQCSLSVYSVM